MHPLIASIQTQRPTPSIAKTNRATREINIPAPIQRRGFHNNDPTTAKTQEIDNAPIHTMSRSF